MNGALRLNLNPLGRPEAMTQDHWPFAQSRDTATVSDVAVMSQGAPVLLVIHYSDDHSWAFLSGLAFSPDRALLVRLDELVRVEGSLVELADLPAGWIAERTHAGAPWLRRPDPEV